MAKLVTLNRFRGSIKAQLTRLRNLVDDETEIWTNIKVQSKLKTIEKIACSVDSLKMDYFNVIPEDQDTSEIETSLVELETRIEELEVSFKELLNSDFNNKFKEPQIMNSSKIKLPEIPLPQFSGKYEDWSVFKTEFSNIITNNEQLSDVQKLHYLHAALKNEAKQLQTPEDTFDSLFEALGKRFENKRIIVNIHLKAILEFEKIIHESSKDLRRLIDVVNKNMRALSNLNFERNKLSDILFTTIILEKLDKDTRKQYELSINTSDVPEFDNLLSFLEKRSNSLESIHKNIPVKSKISNETKSKNFLVNSNTHDKNCIVCGINSHPLFKCSKFLDMPFHQRFAIIKRHKLCLNCFSDRHVVARCESKYTCRVCNSRHNTLLHKEQPINKNETIKQENQNLNVDRQSPDVAEPKQSFANRSFSSNKSVILSTALVYVKNNYGKYICGRTMIDSCSQINCASFDFAKQLGIKKKKVFAPISGLNGTQTTLNYKIKTSITNKDGNFNRELEFFVVPKITEVTPLFPININFADIPSNDFLADPNFNLPGKIDLLLGAECFYDLLKTGQIRSSSQNLLFQETVFGFVASGVVNNFDSESQYCGVLTQGERLEKSLERFWKIETVSHSNSLHSVEEQYCEDHFLETHYRNPSGQYVVSMPMEDTTYLGESKELAIKRLNQLWQRLDRDSNLQLLYSEFMDEYKNLHHMELIVDPDSGNNCYYIPHHGVYRPEKSTTRLRVVFNASASTTSGLSLNDLLLKGKIPQQELFTIMIRFRRHRYTFTADVEKMYRMIMIDPSQRNLLRILWKESATAPVKTYRLNTVTYGTSNAPYLATRTLAQLAIDEQKNLPLASHVVLRDVYIDDVLTGESTLERAKILQSQLIELLKKGNMTLHKWCANHPELLFQSGVTNNYQFDDQPEATSVKTLGVLWEPQIDCFLYRLEIRESDSYSKRDVLSLIAKIFDPLGLLGPVITKAKIYMQRLWLAKLDWSETLPEIMAIEWKKFVSSLSELKNIQIPRYIFREDRIIINGFADASSLAYGASIYVQSLPLEGSPSAQLLCSKSRVAPIKTMTIPRLELSACLLLAKLMNSVLPSLEITIEKVILYTDSTISLAWIRKPPHLLKTFVGNRVATIQELTETFQWQHISSENNPSDKLSRGLDASDLLNCDLWWYGPSMLREDLPHVEKHSIDVENNIEYTSEFKPVENYNYNLTSSSSIYNDIFNLSNNFKKLIRIVSFIFRFLFNCRNSNNKKCGPLAFSEVRKAEITLIEQVQYQGFTEDIRCLKNQKDLPANSKLKFLSPFIDSEGIVRVGGRLDNSCLTYEKKHPVVMPHDHKLSENIFEYFHLKFFHLGPQALLHHVRQRYWIINGRSLARKVVHKCVTCFRNKPIAASQVMGKLPSDRVTPSPPFQKCGIDFCGPFFVKRKHQRKGNFDKIYVAIFVCLATKAIHLDIVTDLKSESFIATLKRFFSRRGKSSTIMTDNGTTFVGTDNELKKLHAMVCKPDDTLAKYLSLEAINWKFIPPRSPNFGGLWEAGVKSFKHHLKRALGNSRVTLEEFLTLIIEIEGILNSRPLLPLSSDPNELDVLTPAHFLIGRPISSVLEPNLTKINDNRLSNWQAVSKTTQLIWKRWKTDYLNHLQEKFKWFVEKENLKEGCMVILKEENVPPCKWALGRILKVIHGPDKKVRVLEIKTSTGIVKRAISKVCPLPLENV